MAVEGDTTESISPAQKRAKEMLVFLDPLLSYATTRVGSLITQGNEEATKGNKFAPEHVDLVEGLKFVVTESEALYLSFMGEPLQDAWNESTVAGPREQPPYRRYSWYLLLLQAL
jgi:hypothetical protein